MLTLKRYANGRFYDPAAKAYVKKEELARRLKKGEKIRIVQSKTDAEVTDEVIAQLGVKVAGGKKPRKRFAAPKLPKVPKVNLPAAKDLKEWLTENKAAVNRHIDRRVEKVLAALNLASRDQVTALTERVSQLTEKLAELEAMGTAAQPADSEPDGPTAPETPETDQGQAKGNEG